MFRWCTLFSVGLLHLFIRVGVAAAADAADDAVAAAAIVVAAIAAEVGAAEGSAAAAPLETCPETSWRLPLPLKC